jgi:nucleotide-binding universal stress UspA family protein
MKILFCSDGSSQAEKAVRFGAQIAAACRAEASVLGITETAGDEDAVLQALRRAQDIFKEYYVDAELITKAGKPVSEIIKRTRETHYDLVVIGAVRRQSFWNLPNLLWMSVQAYEIIESVEPPVLVVTGNSPKLRRILLCTDGSAYIDEALEFTGKIAHDVGAVVDLFHVLPEMPVIYTSLIGPEKDQESMLESNSKLGRTLRHQKDFLVKAGIFGEMRLRQGLVVPELLKELHQTEYDLVVSGSAPVKESLRRYAMGETTLGIINRTMLPVLVIRTAKRRFSGLFKEILAHLFRPSR